MLPSLPPPVAKDGSEYNKRATFDIHIKDEKKHDLFFDDTYGEIFLASERGLIEKLTTIFNSERASLINIHKIKDDFGYTPLILSASKGHFNYVIPNNKQIIDAKITIIKIKES